jgi:hypothetical protein
MHAGELAIFAFCDTARALHNQAKITIFCHIK